MAVLAVMAVAVVGAAGLLRPGPANASSHSAIRSFSAPWVAPGGTLEVTIVAQEYGSFGRIVETLPAGFSYATSDLAEAAVAVEGRTVSFTLLGEGSVTYSVAAPDGEGSYCFSGVLLDENRDRRAIGGTSTSGSAPPRAVANARADGHPRAYAGARANGGTDPNAHTKANGEAYPYAQAKANSGAPTPQARANAYPYAQAKADRVSGSNSHAHGGGYSGFARADATPSLPTQEDGGGVGACVWALIGGVLGLAVIGVAIAVVRRRR